MIENKILGNKGNLPNEEFFVRRIQFSPNLDSGLQLRFEEDEFMKNNTKNPSLQQGKLWKMDKQPTH